MRTPHMSITRSHGGTDCTLRHEEWARTRGSLNSNPTTVQSMNLLPQLDLFRELGCGLSLFTEFLPYPQVSLRCRPSCFHTAAVSVT